MESPIINRLERRAVIHEELCGFSYSTTILRHSTVNAILIPLIDPKKMENTVNTRSHQVIPAIKSRREKANLFMNK
jgi:hypothetical protein